MAEVVLQAGDTGWRDVSGLLEPGVTVASSAGRAVIRRVGSQVFCYLRVVLDDTTRLVQLSSGFRAPFNYLALGGSFEPPVRVFQESGKLRVASSTSATLEISLTWVTDQAWPDELPGTPA